MERDRKFGIVAKVFPDGREVIAIHRPSNGEAWLETTRTHIRNRWKAGALTDFQICLCRDLTDARSAVMTDFGIDWFNRARGQLRGHSSQEVAA